MRRWPGLDAAWPKVVSRPGVVRFSDRMLRQEVHDSLIHSRKVDRLALPSLCRGPAHHPHRNR